MKPEWNEETPVWANYLAQDSNGAWYWFEHQPLAGDAGGWLCFHGDCEEANSTADWRSTLEPRPC